MNLQNYKDEISSLNTLQQSEFVYQTKLWKNLNEIHKSYLAEFENKKISRQDVINTFKNYFQNKSNWQKPFLVTMVWGFGSTGYGCFRTNNYLKNENHNLIINAFDAIKENNIEIAFKNLQGISGLNVSYISKLLYFGTRANEVNNYCLIFDIRVARSLIQLTSGKEIFDLVQITPSTKYTDYIKYNLMLHEKALQLGVEAEKIEHFLFDFDKLN